MHRSGGQKFEILDEPVFAEFNFLGYGLPPTRRCNEIGRLLCATMSSILKAIEVRSTHYGRPSEQ